MSNEITASRVNISTYRDSDGHEALASVGSAEGLSGCAMQIHLRHACNGVFYVCDLAGEEKYGKYIVMLPSDRWKQDMLDTGYKIISKIETGTYSEPDNAFPRSVQS